MFLALASCSTQKNTRMSRNYHAMTARYNIFFNGNEAFIRGVKKVENGLVDDYSRILPMFPYSVHETLKKTTSDMDRTIEKSKKVIRKHSIRTKPVFDFKKSNDPNYRKWYQQEEFNVMVDDAYMRMGQAHFYKAEFLEAIGVFSYIARHFPKTDSRYEAMLWMARAYAEMDWLYEAEDVLKKVNDDAFPRSFNPDYEAITTDVYLKRGLFHDAIPHLKEAINLQKDKNTKRRFTYILAQLYQQVENFDNAVATYQLVLKMSPSYDMAFNARIKLTEVFQGKGNSEGIKKELRKMLKDEKNKDYLDQIYYALGNMELAEGKIEEAMKNYDLSIINSTNNDVQKGLSQVTVADYHFKRANYRKAQPYYSGAATSFGTDYPGVEKINGLAKVLGEMADYFETIETQDSLQNVAGMSDRERDDIIQGIIEKVIEDEKRVAEGGSDGNVDRPVSEWYFYNARLVSRGIEEFERSWGVRELEDNWRRSTKVSLNFDQVEEEVENTEEEEEVFDNKTKEFYLQNIPTTPELVEVSNNDIATSYFNLADIFRNDLQDYEASAEFYNKLLTRYPNHDNTLETLFGLYQTYQKKGDDVNAMSVKQRIINDFPKSRYAVILSDPNYALKLQQAKEEQDSVYEATYKAYLKGDFISIEKNYSSITEKYPDTKLMPNFLFLKTLSIGANGTEEEFKVALEKLTKNYPDNSVSLQAGTILEQLASGKPLSGSKTTMAGLLEKRDNLLSQFNIEALEEVDTVEVKSSSLYKVDNDAKHYFVLMIPTKDVDKDQLLYDIARFNFTKFLIKDFDLTWAQMNSDTAFLVVNGFNGIDEGLWYQRTFMLDDGIFKILSQLDFQRYVITDRNFRALLTSLRFKQYLKFYNTHYKPLEGTIKDPNAEESYNKVGTERDEGHLAAHLYN